MSQVHDYLAALPRDRWQAVQQRIEQFESAWETGQRPVLDAFLPQETIDRGALLAELVHIDLEYRLKAGEPGRVEEYLQRFPELAADPQTAIEFIVVEYRLRARQDPHVSTAEYLSRFPHYRQELAEQLAPVFLRPRALAAATESPDRRASNQGGKIPPGPGVRLDKYLLLGVAGRGACGVVYRAHDTELDRVVALKVYRLDPLATSVDSDRFLREARSAAQLRHPHIVSIFETGRDDDVVYLASEFVAGRTLAERLREGRLLPRQAAQLVACVAEAVDHAHRLGVIHRDLKPSNILLDEADQPHVTDFGLAKRETGDKTLTATGEILGTPAYMSPEQAQGESHKVDARGDVYSLGVVLYELLTGEVPFRGTTGAVLRQVLEENPRPPRRIDEAIPHDLETICMKCLEKEPARRYASAAALAEELGRWLEGKSIRARPPGRLEILGRWCRRNPRVAVLSGMLLVVLAGGFAGVLWQWRRAEAVLVVAQQEHAHAEENFHLALDAVDQYHTQVSQDQLLNEPGMQPLRKKLLETARDFYTRFVRERRQDPKLQVELGRALYRLAVITEQLGTEAEALNLTLQALEVREQLAHAHPQEMVLQLDVAETLNNLANIYTETWQLNQAVETHHKNLHLGERLMAEHAADPAGYLLLVKAGNNLGLIYELLDRASDAEQAYGRGLAAARKLMEDHPETSEYPSRFVHVAYNLIGFYMKQGQLPVARALCREAALLAQKLAKEFPKVPDFQILLAVSVAYATMTQGLAAQSSLTNAFAPQLEKNAADFADALASMRAFARANPSVAEGQRMLVAFLWIAGHLDHGRGHVRAAETTYREAWAIATKLAQSASPSATLQITPIPLGFLMAGLLSDTGRFAEALEVLARARQAWENLPHRLDRHPYYGPLLRPLCLYRALTLCELGRYDEAITEWNRIVPEQRGRFQHLWECCRALTEARRSGKDLAQLGPDLATLTMVEAEDYLRTDALIGGSAYWLADVSCVCARALSEDGRLSAAQKQQRVEQCAARALDLLAKARGAGYFRVAEHAHRLKEDPYLAILRPRKDFQQLLANIQSAAAVEDESSPGSKEPH